MKFEVEKDIWVIFNVSLPGLEKESAITEDVSIIERHTLNYGDCIEGPAVITQSDATTLVLHGQTEL